MSNALKTHLGYDYLQQSVSITHSPRPGQSSNPFFSLIRQSSQTPTPQNNGGNLSHHGSRSNSQAGIRLERQVSDTATTPQRQPMFMQSRSNSIVQHTEHLPGQNIDNS